MTARLLSPMLLMLAASTQVDSLTINNPSQHVEECEKLMKAGLSASGMDMLLVKDPDNPVHGYLQCFYRPREGLVWADRKMCGDNAKWDEDRNSCMVVERNLCKMVSLTDRLDFKDMREKLVHHGKLGGKFHKILASFVLPINRDEKVASVILHNWFYEHGDKGENYLPVDEPSFVPWNSTCAECFWVTNMWPGVAGLHQLKTEGQQQKSEKLAGISWQSRLPGTILNGKLDVAMFQPKKFSLWISDETDCDLITRHLHAAKWTEDKWRQRHFLKLYELMPSSELAGAFSSGYDYRLVKFNEPEKYPGQRLNSWKCLYIQIQHTEKKQKKLPANEFVIIRNIRLYYDISGCEKKNYIIPDIDECLTKPCQNGGTCLNSNGGYNCQCVDGWTGVTCDTDIDECTTKPCQNGGTCLNSNGGYSCKCAKGWTGVTCDAVPDFDECTTKPCQNGGTCLNSNGGYSCTCNNGWTGATCDTGCCQKRDCSDYRGKLDQTKHGRPCQAWNVDKPHGRNPGLTPAKKPESGLDSNFCRNPSKYKTAWCYTMDPNKKWEDCNLPMCDNVAETRTASESERERKSDVTRLYKALKGAGTTESQIIDIIPFRTNAERMQIMTLFDKTYDYPLYDWLAWDLEERWFETTILALMMKPDEYLAHEVHDGFQAAPSGARDLAFVQTICASSDQVIMQMKMAYLRMYSRDMVKNVVAVTTGDFKNLLSAIFEGNRGYNLFSLSESEADEKKLVQPSPSTDAFIRILTTRSRRQLQYTFRNMDIDGIIDASDASGVFKMCAKALAQTAKYQPSYWAGVIHEAVRYRGTDEASLIRAIVSRSEIDLNRIKEAYEVKRYGRLARDVANDTSGNFRSTLLALLREWP